MRLAAAGMAALVLPVLPAHAQPPDRGHVSFVFENDALFSDRNYTSGLRLGYVSGDRGNTGVTRWLGRHLLFADPEDRVRFGIDLGQSIFTPDDTLVPDPPPDERPYAGWLYGALSLLVESESTLDTLALEMGVVGPSAFGEEVQTFVHRLLSIEQPEGWDHQLEDEFGVALHYERKWRLLSQLEWAGVELDLTPSAGLSLGNVLTHANLGVTLRLGDDLRNDFGPPRVRPALAGTGPLGARDSLGGYLYVGVQGRAVAHNLFLDGNTGRSGPDVDRRPLVADLQGGAVIRVHRLSAGVTVVLRTSEFEEQGQGDIFGSLFLAFRL